MKIKYNFANEVIEIEVDEQWGDILIDLDRKEYNNNQAETRRHVSLNAMDYEGEIFADIADIASMVEQFLQDSALHRAIETLLPNQKELLEKIFFKGISAAEIARQEDINKSSVHKRLQRIYEQLKKSLQ